MGVGYSAYSGVDDTDFTIPGSSEVWRGAARQRARIKCQGAVKRARKSSLIFSGVFLSRANGFGTGSR